MVMVELKPTGPGLGYLELGDSRFRHYGIDAPAMVEMSI